MTIKSCLKTNDYNTFNNTFCFSSHTTHQQIHLDLARYHEIGRFSEDENDRNLDGALYHVEQAARCGVLEAIISMARMYCQLPHDVLEELNVDVSMKCNYANHLSAVLQTPST